MKTTAPRISIVTPSFNMLSTLKMCHASVCDQPIAYEHVIVDGGSTDGTREWLKGQTDVVSLSEKDRGMYDALNKAIGLTQGEIIGHLNSDEQYLPGVLLIVQEYFDKNPHVDFIAADFLVLDPRGNLVAFRKSFQPRWPYFFSNYLYTTTSTLFYRRKIFLTCQFDDSYKSIADVIFLYRVLKQGFRGAHVRKYFSTFTFSGNNLSLNPISDIEKKKFNATLPRWYRLLKPAFFFAFFLEKLVNNNYFEHRPLRYEIFTEDNLKHRSQKVSEKPTFRLKFKKSNG